MTNVSVNGPSFDVVPAKDMPLRLLHKVADCTTGSGEVITISAPMSAPFQLHVWGDKLGAVIDLTSVLQEAILHIMRENTTFPVGEKE